jgi:DNA recombination protein Rad52
MTFSPTQVAALAAPLNSAHVASRTQAGRSLSYIEGWHAIAEANRIFGFDAWDRETIENRCVSERERKIGQQQKDGWSVSYVAKVRVTVNGRVREGVGAGHGIDVDLGLAHESAIKEAETDAMKRALMTFGNPFGLALYDKTQANVSDEPVAPPAQPSKYLDHFDAINGAATLEALQTAFVAAKADKSLTKQEADDLITAKDKRKAVLTKPSVAPNFDAMESEIPFATRQAAEGLRV